jgi:hypothetical protein
MVFQVGATGKDALQVGILQTFNRRFLKMSSNFNL